MSIISKVPKETIPPGFGGGRRKERDRLIGLRQGGRASKGIAAAHGDFRR